MDCLDGDQQMIGIPTTVSLPHCEVTNTMFFVVVCPITRVGGRKAPPFENLKLSSQLGKGVQLSQPCSWGFSHPGFHSAGMTCHHMHADSAGRLKEVSAKCHVRGREFRKHGCTFELLCSTPLPARVCR